MGLLRFLFALAVVISHSDSIFGHTLIPGGLAVQSFFMISGFYMALVLNEKYIGEHKSYKLFITNRLIRLFPSYWTVLICVLIFSFFCLKFTNSGKFLESFMMYHSYGEGMSITTMIFLAFTNIFIFFQDLIFFLSLNLKTGNLYFTSNYIESKPYVFMFLFIPQMWSVGIELLFYMIAPLLLRRKLTLIISLIGFSLLLRVILIYNGFFSDPWGSRFFPTELALFLLGAVAYKIYAKIKTQKTNKKIGTTMLSLIILLTFTYSFIDFNYKYIFFLILLFISLPHIFLLTKRMHKDRWIGDLSYPIYISHLFIKTIIGLACIRFETDFWGEIGLVVCVGSIIFSIILNQIIEIPLDKFRQRRIVRSVD